MAAPTIPVSNMKEGDKLPPTESKLIEDEGDEEQIPKVDTPPETQDDKPSGDDKKEDKPADSKVDKAGEDEDGKTSFQDFLNAKEGVFGKKKEEKPLVDKSTDEIKVDDTSRDYSGLSSEETELFKKMGNKTFAHVKPIVLEHKRLKADNEKIAKELADLKVGKVTYPDSIYEHERAYSLTPEFERINNNKTTAEAVLAHWQHQAVLIRKGKDWQDIEEDDKGNMRLKTPQPATDEDEVEVNNCIAFAQRQLSKAEKVHDDFVSGFKARHQTDIDQIKKAETDYFPDYDKPDHPTAQIQKETLEALPKSLRKSPLAPLVCKLVAAAKLLDYRYQQEIKGKNKTAKIEELEKKNGPKADETLGGGTKAASKTPSYSDFQKAKE